MPLWRAGLQDIGEGDEVGLHVVVGVVDAVPDAGLGREVDDPVEAVLGEAGVDLGGVREVCPYEAVSSVALAGGLFQDLEARFLERWVIVGIDHIEAHHGIAAPQQCLGA